MWCKDSGSGNIDPVLSHQLGRRVEWQVAVATAAAVGGGRGRGRAHARGASGRRASFNTHRCVPARSSNPTSLQASTGFLEEGQITPGALRARWYAAAGPSAAQLPARPPGGCPARAWAGRAVQGSLPAPGAAPSPAPPAPRKGLLSRGPDARGRQSGRHRTWYSCTLRNRCWVSWLDRRARAPSCSTAFFAALSILLPGQREGRGWGWGVWWVRRAPVC